MESDYFFVNTLLILYSGKNGVKSSSNAEIILSSKNFILSSNTSVNCLNLTRFSFSLHVLISSLIEEYTSIDNVKMLINRLVKDFDPNRTGDFIITMAPVSSTLSTDGSSFAGFNYKELYNSIEGKYIHWFNTQCYYSYTFETYESIIKNGYPPEKIVMGMESGQFDESSFQNALDEIKKIKDKYPNLSGVFDWEYLNAPPDKNDPSEWVRLMKQI